MRDRWARGLVPALFAALGVVAAACGSATTSGSPGTSAIPPPPGLPAFYSVPSPLPPGPAGRLLKSEPVSSPGLHGQVYRVMYLSLSMQGRPVAVTGLVIVPHVPAPRGGYPVISWGHGTNGMADKCASSLDPANAVPLTNTLLDQGWEVTASDYQGEGTPGLMPYLVGESAARNTVDIVRAARQLPATHASSTYLVWGHSEGGQTAMFALHIGPSYAPELHMAGVVAGAPPSQFNLVYDFLKNSPFRYYLFMAAGGFNAGYGNQLAPLAEVLTPKGISMLPLLEKGCAGYLARVTANVPLSQIAKGNPFSVPAWRALLTANDPQSFTTASSVPLLIIQGGADEQIPPVSTQILASHLCGAGQDLERWIYPGRSHSGVIPVSASDMVRWMSDRLSGAPNPDPYSPAGQSGIQVTRCPS